jgi:phycoerythrobilin:ferredoxin oxidoreductase
LINNLSQYNCLEKIIPSEYSHKDSTYGSKKSKKNVNLYTWCVTHKKRIQLARAVCINSPNYSVLNFLIIPNTIYNVPFFGVDFVSLPNSHLLVLDFQPSLKIQKQYNNDLLEKLIKLQTRCHSSLPLAEKMSSDVARFFSPGVIWSRLPKEERSDFLISNQLYTSFKEYLNLYLEILFESNEANVDLQKELMNGQNDYLKYRRDNDPARPMLSSLFGKQFTESLIKEVLFTT